MTPYAIEHKATRELPASAPARFGEAGPLTSALRRCRQPIPARVAMDVQLRPLRVTSDRRGFAGGTVLSSAGPWRTSGAWWEEVANSELRSQNSEVKDGNPDLRPLASDLGMREVFTRDGDLVTVPRPMSRSPKPDMRSHGSGADDARSRKPEAGSPPAARERSRRDSGPWSRDEWEVALADGAVYRIFRDRVTAGWFIDGVVD